MVIAKDATESGAIDLKEINLDDKLINPPAYLTNPPQSPFARVKISGPNNTTLQMINGLAFVTLNMPSGNNVTSEYKAQIGDGGGGTGPNTEIVNLKNSVNIIDQTPLQTDAGDKDWSNIKSAAKNLLNVARSSNLLNPFVLYNIATTMLGIAADAMVYVGTKAFNGVEEKLINKESKIIGIMHGVYPALSFGLGAKASIAFPFLRPGLYGTGAAILGYYYIKTVAESINQQADNVIDNEPAKPSRIATFAKTILPERAVAYAATAFTLGSQAVGKVVDSSTLTMLPGAQSVSNDALLHPLGKLAAFIDLSVPEFALAVGGIGLGVYYGVQKAKETGIYLRNELLKVDEAMDTQIAFTKITIGKMLGLGVFLTAMSSFSINSLINM